MDKIEFLPIKCRLQLAARKYDTYGHTSSFQENDQSERLGAQVYIAELTFFYCQRCNLMLENCHNWHQDNFSNFSSQSLYNNILNHVPDCDVLFKTVKFYLLQTIFFWTLLIRKIVHAFQSNSSSRPRPESLPQHVIERLDNATLFSVLAEHRGQEISAEQQAQIRDIFQIFDSDHSGTIEGHELGPALFALGFQSKEMAATDSGGMFSTRSDHDQLINPKPAVAKQRTEPVTLEEFSALMRSGDADRDPLDDVWAAFRLIHQLGRPTRISSQGDEAWAPLSQEEVRRACEAYQLNLGQEELDCMMQGPGGSGTVDLGRFARIMCRSPWF